MRYGVTLFMLCFPILAVLGQTPGAPPKKLSTPSLSNAFSELAGDGFDAVERMEMAIRKPLIIFETVRIDAERYVQKLRRTARSVDETKAAHEIATYYALVSIRRMLLEGQPSVEEDRRSSAELSAARSRALQSLGLTENGP